MCQTCKKFKEIKGRHARGNFGNYAVRARTQYGAFNIGAAEMILRLAPREPVRITLQRLDSQWTRHGWTVTKKHLPHVDPEKPGIWATLTHNGRRQVYLIEGFHRATNHRQNRTEWSGYVLTPEESYAILTPLCYCRKGTT
jgi:hypothetical protein